MPEGRPYDSQQLKKLTEQMIRSHSPIVDGISAKGNAIIPPEPSVVHDSEFEHYPSGFEEARTALSGLRRIFTREGRAEMDRERAERIVDQEEDRDQVVRHIAQRISNPRLTTGIRTSPKGRKSFGPIFDSKPGAKVGWVGTSKREQDWPLHRGQKPIRTTPERAEDASNLGYQLMDSKNLKSDRFVNYLRPTTKSEERADRRLEAKREKRVLAQNKSRWLDASYRESLSRGHHRLSRAEAKNMRKISRSIVRQDKRAARAARGFGEIAESRDRRSRISRFIRERIL